MRTSWSIEIMEANRGRERKGIYTVESQNSTVQEAYLRQALADSSPALIVTSADMLDPHERSGKMEQIAMKIGFPRNRLFLGVYDVSLSLER